MVKFIQNIGDFFAPTYFDEDFAAKMRAKLGFDEEQIKTLHKNIAPLKDRYFRYKRQFLDGRGRTKDKIFETHQFHTTLLNLLGYEGDRTQYDQLFHLSETEVIPVRHILYRGEQPHLMIMEMQALIREDDTEPDGLFEQRYNTEDDGPAATAQRYHRSQWDKVFTLPEHQKISPAIINKAVSELFLLDPHLRPRFIILLAGNVIFLLEQEKWFRGSYLQINLEDLFTEATANRNALHYATFGLLLGKATTTPDSSMVLLDQLDEDSHKSAYEVTKDLKEGIIYAVEALANEALFFQKEKLQEVFDETDDRFEQEIKDDCLTIIYRLLFIFYAESREELDILPAKERVYARGYSLEMLRDLEQVPLYSEKSRNGYFFHESLQKLFLVLNRGYRETDNHSDNKSFRVRHIDSPLFDNTKLYHLHKVKFRNHVWQDIICRLSLSKEKGKKSRGRISYANLGINQLGSVYESLLAYRGFYAEQDYIEVHKAGKPEEGTFLVPRQRMDDFTNKEILKDPQQRNVIIPKGTFVYRLSGRDRQKSASYYTPEVLTQCTVKYTLKPLLERLDKGEMKAADLLDLKLLEPAMGAAAFHNEMINQLAEAYLSYRQKELNKRVAPDRYREELQKIKAHIATRNVYGVDLNPTAIELGKLSLWLNVIHRDMETPFFSNRICTGNAVVGAWLKVYDKKAITEEYATFNDAKGKPKRVAVKKEWWETAPRNLEFTPNTDLKTIKHKRKPDEIYHFLLPDKNMLASAGIKILKAEHEAEYKRVAEWKREWTQPVSPAELELLKKICDHIDTLLAEYYHFQRRVNALTASNQHIFGAPTKQGDLELRSYAEKERLADERNRQNAPYFKLKMVMDYWCSLWFWDLRDAAELPSRQQFWHDIRSIVQLDVEKTFADIQAQKGGQLKMFEAGIQTALSFEETKPDDSTFKNDMLDTLIQGTDRRDLFDNNQRLETVKKLAEQYHFFHPQLEFLEVFWERGGFDLIAGNPPWLKLQFEESGIISEKYPEIAIRNESAPKVRAMQTDFFADARLKEMYLEEAVGTECTALFLNATQNYPLLKGQQTNLYKCVLENGFGLLNRYGFMGLIHPEGVYDDPNGQVLRQEIYRRLRYHFQFKNELVLFAEIDHHNVYSVNIYAGAHAKVDFLSMNNLFHPSTIAASFLPHYQGPAGGIKIKDEATGKYVWNIQPHADRVVHFTEKELRILAKTFENSEEWETAKLVSVHASKTLLTIEKIGDSQYKVRDHNQKTSRGFDETNSVNDGSIKRLTKYADVENYELIYNGPHFFVACPFYKTPREICTLNSHYDGIDLTLIDDDFLPRTNYVPVKKENLEKLAEGLGTKLNEQGENVPDNYFDYYKVIWSRMISVTGERSLQAVIGLPKIGHVHTVNSIIFEDTDKTVELSGLLSSIVLDFFVKTIGRGDLWASNLMSFPLGIAPQYRPALYARTLLLNCLNKYYAPLWSAQWDPSYAREQWSKQDARLKPFATLSGEWTWDTPLRNWYERRQALVEIDVITAMALGLSLEELVLIYNVQFPVLQQNEDDTWYDQRGNIVFTCSKGLTGVGVDRPVWEQIRHLGAGETYRHTITKSELYQGREVVYEGPFERCDRVKDYEVAWNWWEGVFGGK